MSIKEYPMGIRVKKFEQVETGTLYVRGVTLENIKFLKYEYERLGYESLGQYMNELARTLRKELIDAGGEPVRYKGRQKTKKSA